MPVDLNVNQNRFVTVRSHASSIEDDTLPLPMNLANDQRFNSQGARNIVFYWERNTGVTPATIDITVYFLDDATSKFLLGDKISNLAPDTLAELQCLHASNAVLAISGTGGPVATGYAIRAMGIT